MKKNITLAFTGGLQSSVCLHWLSAKRGANVQALIIDLGPKTANSEMWERAVKLGAEGAHVEDCRQEFIKQYAFRALRASAVYERGYLLSGALAKPLIVEVMVRRAREEGHVGVAVGTYQGMDDAVRFQSMVNQLAPELDIIAPEEIPPLVSPEAAMEYAEDNDILPREDLEAVYRHDVNLWGRAAAPGWEWGTWDAIPDDYYLMTENPKDAPDEPDLVNVEFEEGNPVTVDGTPMAPHELVQHLNQRAGRHGVGRIDAVGDRLFGRKARELYEAPGAKVLMEAHFALEKLCLDYETLQAKGDIGRFYANLVYKGGWFKSLRKAYDGFIDHTQENINGEVRLKLFKGNVIPEGRRSPNSLFDR